MTAYLGGKEFEEVLQITILSLSLVLLISGVATVYAESEVEPGKQSVKTTATEEKYWSEYGMYRHVTTTYKYVPTDEKYVSKTKYYLEKGDYMTYYKNAKENYTTVSIGVAYNAFGVSISVPLGSCGEGKSSSGIAKQVKKKGWYRMKAQKWMSGSIKVFQTRKAKWDNKKKYVGYGAWSKGTVVSKTENVSGVKCHLIKQ